MFPKIGVPQIIHFNRVFHYKPSILGYPDFWKHPILETCLQNPFFYTNFSSKLVPGSFQVTCLRENLPLFFPSKKSSATPKRPIFETDFGKITGIYELTKTSQKTKITFTPWKFNSSPLKISHPKRNVIFQRSFFQGLCQTSRVFFWGA